MTRKSTIAVAIVFMGLLGLEVGGTALNGGLSIVSPAEAKVGRPLTPVSVAGSARRTVRRCAAGVYNC